MSDFSRFIAGRIFFHSEKKRSSTNSIVNIALYSISIGMVVMLITVSTVRGYKAKITETLTGIGSDISITNFSKSQFDSDPIFTNSSWLDSIKSSSQIAKAEPYINKAGIIKKDMEMSSTILRGVDHNFDWSVINSFIVKGELPNINREKQSNDIVISEKIANRLGYDVGDKITIYLSADNRSLPRPRVLRVSGLYRSSFEEFDNNLIFGDIKLLQRFNGWEANQAEGYNITLKNFDHLQEVYDDIESLIINNPESEIGTLYVTTITEQYRYIFDWLEMLDINIWVILTLVIAVTGFNMISAIIILILDRITMIATLKTMGYSNRNIISIFTQLGALLITKGVLIGNVVGLIIIYLQDRLRFIKLNPEDYNISYLPVEIDPVSIIILNLAVISTITVILIIPSLYISKIEPSRAIQFE